MGIFLKSFFVNKIKALLLQSKIGVWRSWLAHLHGVQGVGSSSLLTPTKRNRNQLYFNGLRFFILGSGLNMDAKLSYFRISHHLFVTFKVWLILFPHC